MHPSLWECATILCAVHLNVMLCEAIRLMSDRYERTRITSHQLSKGFNENEIVPLCAAKRQHRAARLLHNMIQMRYFSHLLPNEILQKCAFLLGSSNFQENQNTK